MGGCERVRREKRATASPARYWVAYGGGSSRMRSSQTRGVDRRGGHQ
eukprot:CAMPEP_0198693252 /NCGR_PEP_ID=MMETSP1468-20131203/246610_1 /TAXON_ID=1461545 /ORGANISM="Mantoniella sp, Strain CCMP1436" /LENGTH=46 /DNA_ID= /DNA_START= /DNA_END= /DNA_ORIENTATION=